MRKINKGIIFLFVLTFFIIPQKSTLAVGDDLPGLNIPKTLEEARTRSEIAKRIGEIEVKRSWKKAIDIWKKICSPIKNFLQKHLRSFWGKIKESFFQKFESKKDELKIEFEKDKESIKDIAKEKTVEINKSIWDKIKEKIKDKLK